MKSPKNAWKTQFQYSISDTQSDIFLYLQTKKIQSAENSRKTFFRPPKPVTLNKHTHTHLSTVEQLKFLFAMNWQYRHTNF